MNYDIIDRYEAARRSRTQNIVGMYLDAAHEKVAEWIFKKGGHKVHLSSPGGHEPVADQEFVKIFIETYTEMGFKVTKGQWWSDNGYFHFDT